MNEEKALLEVDKDTAKRFISLMRVFRISDIDEAINEILDQIEISGWRRRKRAMDAVERIFTLRCPFTDKSVPMSQCEDCPYCAEINEVEGKCTCTYGESREIEFMTLCPRMRSTTTVVNCSDCRFGKVSTEYGTVVCKYFD